MSKTASTAHASEPQSEEVLLAADHKHAGQLHKKGTSITVPKHVADWLRSNAVVGQPTTAE
jgi:hypothetical protein